MNDESRRLAEAAQEEHLLATQPRIVTSELKEDSPSALSATGTDANPVADQTPLPNTAPITFQSKARIWFFAWVMTFVLNPIVSLCVGISSLVSLLTLLDLPELIGGAAGIQMYWLHIQFSWLSLFFPSLLLSSMGMTDGSLFFSVICHCFLLALLSGSVQCVVDAYKDQSIPKPLKGILAVTTTVLTILVCPLTVPLYWLLYKFPKLQSNLASRWTSNQRIKFEKEDFKHFKAQMLVLILTMVALLGMNFIATLVAVR